MIEIEGWLTPKEGRCLQELVGKAPGKIIVEIGAWKGRSTAYLLETCQEHDKVLFTVDHFRGSIEHQIPGQLLDTYPEFKANIAKIPHDPARLHVMKMDSLVAANRFEDRSIGLIFIDGSHEYVDIKADLAAWLPKVVGIVAVHDSNDTNVQKAINELNITRINQIDSLAWWHNG